MGISKKVFRSDIDVNKYELLQARLENLASAPGTPGLGQVYYDTGNSNFFGWDGTAWRQLDEVNPTDKSSFNTALSDGTFLFVGDAPTAHTHILTSGATDVTATFGELNLLDLSGLTLGWVLSADGATTASWKAPGVSGATTLTELTDVTSATQTAGFVLASSGGNYAGRALIAGDIPALAYVATGITTLAGYGISDTMANFDTAVSNGNFVWESDTSTSGWSFVIDDDTMATASATNLASSESIKQYVDNAVVGGMVYKGAEDASTAPPTGAGILIGWTYTVTVGGNGGGFWTTALEIGDVIIAETTNPSVEADWTVVSRDLPAGITSKYATDIGNGALTTIPVTHSFGTKDITVEVTRIAAPYDVIECQIVKTDTNTINLGFNVAPTSSEFRVVVVG